MTAEDYSFMVISFMFCSICLYVIMPKILSRVSNQKMANMIFLIFWSVTSIVGVGFATHVIFY
jgi:hypothetical protein